MDASVRRVRQGKQGHPLDARVRRVRQDRQGALSAVAAASPAPSDATAALLWRDAEIFESRYRKSAAALVALRRVLADAPAAHEFAALYDAVAALPSRAFTRAWTDPGAYFWVRMAYQLTATCTQGAALPPLGAAYCAALGVDAPEALRLHLEEFKRFALGAHAAAGRALALRSPWVARLPFTLPGTGLVAEGEGQAAIAGVARKRLRAADGAAPSLTPSPTASHAGASMVLEPAAFHYPALDFARPALESGRAFQERHRGLVSQTLAVIQTHQRDTFVQLRDVVHTLALKPMRTGGYTNISHSDLPGAFIASVVQQPYELADTFIHEFHHNRLFFIEERGGPFFDPAAGDAVTEARYYSAWRDDPRPLHGIFHAVYVSIPVLRYWLAVLAGGAAEIRDYALDRSLRFAAQLADGVEVLERHATFTPFGRTLFDELKAEVARLDEEMHCRRGLPRDAPALACAEDGTFAPELSKVTGRALTVREATAEHRARHDPERRAQA